MELQWPLILFTTLVAWSAGLFGTQALLAAGGHAKKAQMPAWVASAVLLAAGGIAVFFHLEHWERIFNGFGHLTSGITQELIAIVALAVVAVAYLVMMRRSRRRRHRPEVAVLGVGRRVRRPGGRHGPQLHHGRPPRVGQRPLDPLRPRQRVRARPLHDGADHGRGRRRDGAGRPAGPRRGRARGRGRRGLRRLPAGVRGRLRRGGLLLRPHPPHRRHGRRRGASWPPRSRFCGRAPW